MEALSEIKTCLVNGVFSVQLIGVSYGSLSFFPSFCYQHPTTIYNIIGIVVFSEMVIKHFLSCIFVSRCFCITVHAS